MKKNLFSILMLSAILLLAGCEPPVTPVITLDKNTLSLKPDETHVLIATISPADTTAIIEWTSSKPEVATVDANGQVTALTVGFTTITASSANAESAQCVVTVIDNSILFESNDIEMGLYDTKQLVAVLPEWASATQITWVSSDSAVATISNSGVVEAKSEGTTIITASAEGLKSAQCTIKVVNNIPASFPRKFLIEHFTGDQCGYCPDGMYAIRDHIANAEIPYIWVSHHYGYNTDEYSIAESQYIGKNVGVQGAPNMDLNRTKLMGSTIAFHPGYLPDLTNTIAAKFDTTAEASVVINHSYDAATRQLEVTVSGLVGNTDVKEYLVSVLVKENGLIGKQADYSYAWKSGTWTEFMHPRVIRDFITHHFGDTVTVAKQRFSRTWTYTLSEEWNAEKSCVVAYITPLAKRPIVNAEQAPIVAGTTGGEQYTAFAITSSNAPTNADKLTFETISYSKPSADKLLVTLFNSKSVKTNYGAAKSLLTLEFNTTEDKLPVGTFDILPDNTENTMVSGSFDADNLSFGGSYFQYVQIQGGDTIPRYTWRINTGKIQIEENGNILMAGNFYNKKHYTITYTAQ
jgi:hypothetical protein